VRDSHNIINVCRNALVQLCWLNGVQILSSRTEVLSFVAALTV
jgi:hypothetical protein